MARLIKIQTPSQSRLPHLTGTQQSDRRALRKAFHQGGSQLPLNHNTLNLRNRFLNFKVLFAVFESVFFLIGLYLSYPY